MVMEAVFASDDANANGHDLSLREDSTSHPEENISFPVEFIL